MGGAVSAGKNNDELIDNLVEADFIKTPLIQQIFRAVDRGNYYADGHKENAYRDMAWRLGNLHLSAPCVYSEVMEALKLRSGLSFLNLGSGSGYLSTMAGLILGPYGINHGIELYGDVVDFAYDKLENFMLNSNAIDEFEFCEPTFVVGNCLMLDSSCQQYDRVYCGAACPEEHETYIKNLVKIGGILIMPLNDKLLKITRTGESTWQQVKVLSVSFAPLISPQPTKGPVCHINFTNFCPPTLQQLCRSQVRTILRQNIDKEHPNLMIKLKRLMERRQRRQVRRIVIPIFDESDIASNNSGSNTDFDPNESDSSPEYTISSHIPSRMSVLLEDFLRRHAEMQHLTEMAEQDNNSESDETTEESIVLRRSRRTLSPTSDESADEKPTLRSDVKPQSGDQDKPVVPDKKSKRSDGKSTEADSSKPGRSGDKRKAKSVDKGKRRSKRFKPKNDDTSSDDSVIMETGQRSTNSHELLCSASFITLSNRKPCVSDPQPTTSRPPPPRRQKPRLRKRKSADSEPSTSAGRSSHSTVKFKRRAATVIWKRIIPKESDSEKDEGDVGNNKPISETDEENYTSLMLTKINDLPLPLVIRKYINYRRSNI